jgi:hypothetical protein
VLADLRLATKSRTCASLLKRDPANTTPAEEAFLTAIAAAQQQRARSFELPATTSLARLWRDQGKREEARDLLRSTAGSPKDLTRAI